MKRTAQTSGVATTRQEVVQGAAPISSPTAVAVAGLVALAVAMGIGRFAFTPILPMMQEDAGVTVARGGWLASANYAGYLLGALSAIAIRVPASAAIRLGLLVIGVATLAMGFEHRVARWVVLRGVAGIASAWVMISVSAWALARLAPVRRPVLNSTVFAGVGSGIAAAGVVCLALMHARAGSAQAWIGLGLMAVAVTVITWRVFAEPATTETHRSPRPGSSDRSIGDCIRLVFCYGAFGFGYIIPATFLPVMARHEVQDARMFGWAWPVFGIAAAASTFSGAIAARIGGNRRLWMLSQLVMAVGVSLPVFVSGLMGIFLAALCVGGTFMVNTMAGMQEARHVAAADATRLMAAMTAAFALGQILGPILVSYAIEAGASFSTPLLIASAVLVVSASTLAHTGTAGADRGHRTAPREAFHDRSGT